MKGSFFRNFLASACGVVIGGMLLIGALAFGAALPLPGGGSGPQLGDPVTNLYTLTQAYTMGRGLANLGTLSASQTNSQTGCTQLSQAPQYSLVNVSTSSSTGALCLPTAYSGSWVVIANSTSQTINLYSSLVSFTPGTTDNINTSAGSSAYAGLTTHKVAICYAVANGSWFCGSVS